MDNISHFTLIWWWMLLLLPAPLLVYYLAPTVKETTAIRLPYLPSNADQATPSSRIAKCVAVITWILLVFACARPVWYGDPVDINPEHRDMMLVVDLSGSMAQQDMAFQGEYLDRLSAVKNVLSDFIDKRKGDRLGLILFADHAYLQTPLTLDRATIKTQLNQAVLRMIGEKTAIGEGIGLATKTFLDSEAPQRVIVLLSDGSNTSGVLDPIEAAEIAKKYQATIYTIGVGAGEMVVKDFFFNRTVNTARDLDEASLIKIAEITGGEYFRARNHEELQTIYQTIDQLEPITSTSQTWRPQTEWFPYPLGLALILSVILAILRKGHV